MNQDSKGPSIFFRLLIAFVSVVIVLSTFLTAIFYFFSKKSIEKQTEEYVRQQFQTLSYHFRSELRNTLVKDLQLLASNPLLDDFVMSSETEREVSARALERALLESLRSSRSYQSIAFVDAVGREAVKVDWSGLARKSRMMGNRDLFVRLEKELPGSIESEGPFIDQFGNLVFSTAVYITDEDIGQFGGALIIDYSLDEFFSYVDRLKVFDENTIWIFSPDGGVLKRPNDERSSFDPRPYFSKGFQREAVLSAVDGGMLVYQDLTIVPDRPLLRLAISVPSSLLMKDTRSVLQFFLAVSLASIFLISLLAYYLAKYLSGPIVELARAAARIARGDRSAHVHVKATGEVQMLVNSFNRMAEDLEKTTVSRDYVAEINEELKNFAYIVSHDLRVPLVNIKGFSDELLRSLGEIEPLLQEYLKKIENKDREKYLNVLEKEIPDALKFIGSSVKRMDSLISAILKLSRAGMRKITLERLNMNHCLETILHTLAHQIESRHITVRIEPLPYITADRTAIEQIFGNLLDNSVKYLQPERPGEIEIRAELTDDRVIFHVRDNGRGIAKEDIPRAFEIFRRVGENDVPGEGIGLAYVKTLVRLLGGRIWCESEPGMGTTFSFSLPLLEKAVGGALPEEEVNHEQR